MKKKLCDDLYYLQSQQRLKPYQQLKHLATREGRSDSGTMADKALRALKTTHQTRAASSHLRRGKGHMCEFNFTNITCRGKKKKKTGQRKQRAINWLFAGMFYLPLFFSLLPKLNIARNKIVPKYPLKTYMANTVRD